MLPLTAEIPKCLVPLGGKPLLDRELAALQAAGIGETLVVHGYRAERLAAHVATLPELGRPLLRYNPFWSVSGSIGSVWIAREAFAGPFLLANGDTVFSGALLADALTRAASGVNLLVEHCPIPEADDMRVQIQGDRVRAVGKRLPAETARHRSLCIVICRDADGGGYCSFLDRVIAEDNGCLKYHHDVLDRMAREARVTPLLIESREWLEVDTPADVARWRETGGIADGR